MAARKHKTLIVTVIVLIVIVLLLRFSKGGFFVSNTRAANLPSTSTNNYVVDGSNFSYVSGAINIPGLVINGSRDLHIIGSCSSDCMSRKSSFADPYGTQRGVTYVTNQASRPYNNFYNVTEVVAPQPMAWSTLFRSA
jgi:hypothetical protein